MDGYILRDKRESVTLPAAAVDRLLQSGQGDAALLYLALRRFGRGVTPEELEKALPISRLRIDAAEKKLQAAQEKTAAFIRRSEELCQAQSAFLKSLPELDFVPEQPESPAAEPQADVVSAIEQDILSKYIDAPEEKGAGSAVTDEPTIKLPPVDGSAIPSDFRLSLDELKFGRNYSGDK